MNCCNMPANSILFILVYSVLTMGKKIMCLWNMTPCGLVPVHHTTWYHFPEHHNIHIQPCERGMFYTRSFLVPKLYLIYSYICSAC